MTDAESERDFPDQGQRAAFCLSRWEDRCNTESNSMADAVQMRTLEAPIQGDIRIETLDDREWAVAPVVAIVPGVLNGALIPEEEIREFASAWNGVPVPVGHPKSDGEAVTANSPSIESQRNIGRLYNARFEEGRLKGEIWIDVNKAERLGFSDLVERIRSNDVMEVSTAYWPEIERAEGLFNGEVYEEIHRNLRPDHLAILPNERGACSVEDGCGVPRSNSVANQVINALKSWFKPNQQEVAHRKLEAELERKLLRENPNRLVMVIDVLSDGTFVYKADRFGGDAESDPFRVFQRPYEANENGEVTLGSLEDTIEVEPVTETEFVPVANRGSQPMDRDSIINNLITNDKSPWEEDDRKILESLGDEKLKALDCGCGEKSAEPEASEPEAKSEKDADPVLNEAAERVKVERSQMVERLTQNERCDLDRKTLEGFDYNTLKKLDASFSKVDYSAASGEPVYANSDDGDGLVYAPWSRN